MDGEEGDRSEALAERVREAGARAGVGAGEGAGRGTRGGAGAAPLAVRGRGTRGALGHEALGETLSVREHAGIVNHEPTELLITARAGTPVATLNAALEAAGQMLPFEPPDEGGTLGGVIACGLSGPRRPYAGAARDFVLGTRVINGRGQILGFGGEVMKNVAGYDVSRVQTGAFGTLGVLLDISMKVLPRPEFELTLHHELGGGAGEAGKGVPGTVDTLVAMARRPVPLSASMVIGADRFVRLGGSRVAVEAAAAALGGNRLSEAEAPWEPLRERRHPFFDEGADERPLWRIAVADHAPPLDLPGSWLLDWGGAQRWLRSEAAPEAVFAAAAAAGGHARRYRRAAGGAGGGFETLEGPLFQPIGGPMRRLQARLRDSFDPERLFNRGRFHPELDTPEPDGPDAPGSHAPSTATVTPAPA